MRRSLRLFTVLALVAAPFAVLGCGGGDDDSGTSSDADATAAVRDIQPDAQQRAESVVLQLSDFPTGWRGGPSEDDDEGGEEFRKCISADLSDLTLIGDADSDDFRMGDEVQVSAEVEVVETPEAAAEAATAFDSGITSQEASECFKKYLEESIAEDEDSKGVEVGDVDIGELSFNAPAGIEEAHAYQLSIPLEAQGASVTVYVDFILLRQGDLVATLDAESQGTAFDETIRDGLVNAMAGRMTGGS